MKAARATWFARVAAATPARLIFLDETWFTTAMERMYGYAPRGHRLYDAAPLRRWTRLTFVAGLTVDGVNRPAGVRRVDDRRSVRGRPPPRPHPGLPPRRCRHPGQPVGPQDDRGPAGPTDGRGAARYLPAYSPDRNPIEQAFSKLKRLARTAAERTADGLKKLTRTLARKLRPPECRNYIRHSGYHATIT